MAKYISCAETAKLVRLAPKEAFPGSYCCVIVRYALRSASAASLMVRSSRI